MNIEHKKTALEDGSAIYQRRNDNSKPDFKSLTFTQKLEYFKDYYLRLTVVGIILLVLVISMLDSMVFNRQTEVCHIVFLNSAYLDNTDGLVKDLSEYLAIEPSHEFISTSNFNLENYQINMGYSAQQMAGAIDVIVCDEEYFVEASSQGIMLNLHEVLSEEQYTALEDHVVMGTIVKTDNNGNVLSTDVPRPYGIDITDSPLYKQYYGVGNKAILCISSNSKKYETAAKVLMHFTDGI